MPPAPESCKVSFLLEQDFSDGLTRLSSADSIVDSVKELFLKPWKFVQRRSYHLVTGVYFSTCVCNLVNASCPKD